MMKFVCEVSMNARIRGLLVVTLVTLSRLTLAEEPTSFVMVEFPVPEGWKRFQSERPKTVGVMLHGGNTMAEADGMIQLDIGRPVLKTAREFAESIAGQDGSIDKEPVRLAGVEALRVTTPSTDFSRPKLALIAYYEDQVYFLAAAAKPGFDVEPALKSIIEKWRWRDTDNKRLAGEWEIERIEVGGNVVAAKSLPTGFIVNQGRFTLISDGQPVPGMKEMVIVVDREQKPAHLDLVRGMRESLPCLYQLEKNELTLAMPLIPKDKKPEDPLARPKSFDSKQEPIMLFVVKPKTPPAEPAVKPEPK